MPLHPVPIIIGTTLAVIGSGYAFKKFIYDPHLAPFIEAFLAQHQLGPAHQLSSPSDPYPVSVPSSAQSSARQHPIHARTHQGHLRRRSHARRSSVHELEESSIHNRRLSHGSINDHRAYEGDGSKHSHSWSDDASDHSSLAHPRPHRSRLTSRKSSVEESLMPMIESPPETPQEAEIREVIFNYAPTPSGQSGSSTPATMGTSSINPFLSPLDYHMSATNGQPAAPLDGLDGSGLQPPAPSTTFSFLSLSQQSSPADTHQTLESLSFPEAGAYLRYAPSPSNRMNGDVYSLNSSESERLSEYVDAESYSPSPRAPPSANLSPVRHPLVLDGNSGPSGSSYAADAVANMGFSYIHPVSPPVASQTGRGPMSVISVSESEPDEACRSESDWEAVGSDAGR